MSPVPDPWLRTPAQLERAARQHLRHQQAEAPPWLVPILFVPGVGGSRLALVHAHSAPIQEQHDDFLWDPDSVSQHRLNYGWIDQPEAEVGAQHDAAALELAQRWQAPAQVMRRRADDAGDALTRPIADLHGLPSASALLPELHQALLAQARAMEGRGWTALPQAYMALERHLSDMPQAAGDPQFAFVAHAHGWDWRQHPSDAAPGLANAIRGLLSQAHAHPTERSWRWPGQPGLVIVAENAGVELVRAALPLCPAGSIMAVYAVDDVRQRSGPAWLAALCNARDPGAAGRDPWDTRLLSAGFSMWQAAFRGSRTARLAVNAVLAGPLSLLTARSSAFGFSADAPREVLDDPWCLLRAGTGWDEQAGMAPLLQADPSWHAKAKAVAQDLQQRAAEPPAPMVSWVDCLPDGSSPTILRLRWQRHPARPGPGAGTGPTTSTHQWQLAVDASEDPLRAPPDETSPILRCNSAAQLCSQIRRDIRQRLLRQPPTPTGQNLQTWFAERVQNASRDPSHGIPS